jgi:hypothetical protein
MQLNCIHPYNEVKNSIYILTIHLPKMQLIQNEIYITIETEYSFVYALHFHGSAELKNYKLWIVTLRKK